MGVRDLCARVGEGDRLLLDGVRGVVVVHPTPAREKEFARIAREEGFEQIANAGRTHSLDIELVVATRFIQGDERAHLHLHAILWTEGEQLRAVAPHGATDLSVAVLEGEVKVSGGGAGEVGYLPAYPHQGQGCLEGLARKTVERRHRKYRSKLHSVGV